MKKNIKLSLFFVLILIIVCTIVVIWNPLKRGDTNSASVDSAQSVSNSDSTASNSQLSTLPVDSILVESATITESSKVNTDSDSLTENLSEISDLIPEDQPVDPDLNFEASGSSYDDIMVNVLTCLLSKDMSALSDYVGSIGLRLSPTGICTNHDLVLSNTELSEFFSLGSQTYGTYPGSGEAIYLTPEEYYTNYLVPDDFDFSAASVSYNDANDLSAVSGYAHSPKTVSYRYAPSVMEWKRLILVYDTEDTGDVLCAIIYQDATTN